MGLSCAKRSAPRTTIFCLKGLIWSGAKGPKTCKGFTQKDLIFLYLSDALFCLNEIGTDGWLAGLTIGLLTYSVTKILFNYCITELLNN